MGHVKGRFGAKNGGENTKGFSRRVARYRGKRQASHVLNKKGHYVLKMTLLSRHFRPGEGKSAVRQRNQTAGSIHGRDN